MLAAVIDGDEKTKNKMKFKGRISPPSEVFFSGTFGLSAQALAPHLERHSPQRVLSIFLPSLYWRTQVGADNKI